ncbi:hypothetical protein [Methylomicrobium lacus]|uniref:hypothetical protein n=1 Tax=Methylomicrobium lacus TaxID=136992 RepID=UPI0035A89643
MKRSNELDNEYLENQMKRMDSYIVGGNNPAGEKIVKIYAKGDEFLVYDIAAPSPIESLRVLIDTRDEVDMEPVKLFDQVKDEFDKFKSVMNKTGADSSYKHRAANAISIAIYGDTEKARNILINIQNEIISEFQDRLTGRISYFGGAVGLVLFFQLFQ